MNRKTLLAGLLVTSFLVAGCSSIEGEDLQGKFSTSDTRMDCDYGSDTSVANLRECLEDFIVDEYRVSEGEHFDLIYNRLSDIEDQLDAIEAKIDAL